MYASQTKIKRYNFHELDTDIVHYIKVFTDNQRNSFRASAYKYAQRHVLKAYISTMRTADGHIIFYVFKAIDEETSTS